jgi:negative regulator of flagellin synthesis FlgM
MRIDPSSGLPIDPATGRVAGTSGAPPPGRTDPAANDGQDQAHISADAQQLSRFSAALQGAPEIRQDQVDQVRNAINSGTFTVSNAQIADAILQDVLPSSGAGQ